MVAAERPPAGPVPDSRQVADGIYRLGDRYVNWYVLEDRGRLTIIDSGLPAHWEQLPSLLQSIGRGFDDIAALLLTHSHGDHMGCAERVRRATRAPVLIHDTEETAARNGGSSPPLLSIVAAALLRPPCGRYFLHVMGAGVARIAHVAEVGSFRDGDRLDVPGSPRVVHAPGHTPGECAFLVEERNVLLSGDALITFDPTRGIVRPTLPGRPFTTDETAARESLARIEATGAMTILPGHGEPWFDGVVEAVRLARRA